MLNVLLNVVTLQDPTFSAGFKFSTVSEEVETPSPLFKITADIHVLTTCHQKRNLKILLSQPYQNNKTHIHFLIVVSHI